MPSDLRGARALVLGASGFLGGRLVERLVAERGASVRILMRRVAAGTPAVRFPVEVHVGDLLDTAAVARAMSGCDVVFNCAKGTGGDPVRRRAVDVDAAGQVVESASRAGARVVHVSTFAVYDLPADGEVNEDTAAAPPGDAYSDGKRAGERLALDAGRQLGVPVTVIQPTVVYGPRAGVHAAEILEEMRGGRIVLINGGTGICNAVYVDDVVTALLLAAGTERGAGERILVSGSEHPTWARFFGAFERMLGREATVAMAEDEALALWQRSRRRPWLAGEALKALREDMRLRKRLLATREGALILDAARRLVPGLLRKAERSVTTPTPAPATAPGPSPARPWLVRYLAKRARVRIDRARELLGYEPVFGLEAGMRVTEQWARWAGLVP
ncbi:MAG: NAD-dependent epimerase/dehydratase family protein [Chloroflexota bacterium]|nr:NAD-dependent epimerase/dehydratase family protein [Chloroflexota bacterium]